MEAWAFTFRKTARLSLFRYERIRTIYNSVDLVSFVLDVGRGNTCNSRKHAGRPWCGDRVARAGATCKAFLPCVAYRFSGLCWFIRRRRKLYLLQHQYIE